MLVSEHGAHKAKVVTLGATMNLPATDATKPDADAMYQQLQGLSGAEFDRAFVDGMIVDHEKTIAMYEAQANAAADSPVKALAVETLPTLRRHLEAAQELKASL